MNYKSYQDFSTCIFNNLYKIPYETDLLVGIDNNGLLIALMISKFTNIRVATLEQFFEKKMISNGNYSINQNCINDFNQIKNVLMVSDSVNTGKTINEVKNRINQSNEFNNINIKYFTVYYVNNSALNYVDIALQKLNTVNFLQFNFLFNPIIFTNSCFDIDGAICRDPSPQEDDDGRKYIDFIRNVIPFFKTDYIISCFVTSRLQKYREQTQNWLRKNNFNYKELIMLDLPSKEERNKLNMYGRYKGEIYKYRPENLFVQSSKFQAIEIVQISGKEVFCTENMKLYKP